MDLSEEWKSLWPISSAFSPPLLLPSNHPKIGPLIFNPSQNTLTQLLSSHYLFPLLPPPFPNFSLSRFLHSSTSHDYYSFSLLLPSTSKSIATQFGSQLPEISSPLFEHNRLQLLRCPGTRSVLSFFPTGDNSDQVGFVILSSSVVKDEDKPQFVVRACDDKVFVAENKLNQRILRLLVNPVADFDDSFSASGTSSSFVTVGYLLACTMYSVYWYSIRIRRKDGLDIDRVVLDFLGSKLFKSCAVVHACWSPHLPEECVVLMESGELFLFDLNSSCYKTRVGLRGRFLGKNLKVLWSDITDLDGKGGWLSCEFSWHPRILVVTHSSSVFLVDLRSDGCSVSCLLKIDMLSMGNAVKNDQFVALSRAEPDGFYFVVASNHMLLLCDVRKPLMAVLRWAHSLDTPTYITVFRLSDLRAHANDDSYKWASESGYCILLGSFWNCEFGIFCYGPVIGGTVASEISQFCKSFYAWGLPSELSLSGRGCNCGSCLVREDFSKDAFPEWIDWRQKKEIVLGFGILDQDLSLQLSEPDSFGGFSLIRLISSGKLELQTYCASWECANKSCEAHGESSVDFEDPLLYAIGDDEYKFRKKFQHLKFDYLDQYLKNNLAKVMRRNTRLQCEDLCRKDSFRSGCHLHLCSKLKACGFTKWRSSPTVRDVFEYISFPTSIHEIALQSIWSGLPIYLLRISFSTYSDFPEARVNQKHVALEFLDVPDQRQLPPFPYRKPSSRSTKWSQKTQPSNDLVGPVVPLHPLIVLCKLRADEETDGFSADTELELQCNKVVQVANEVTVSESSADLCSEHVVSLADDRDETCYGSQRAKPYALHEPAAFSGRVDPISENSRSKNKRFTATLIFKTRPNLTPSDRMEMAGLERFDTLCPAELRFNDRTIRFGLKELKSYQLFRRQNLNFQEGIDCYQEYLVRSNINKQDP